MRENELWGFFRDVLVPIAVTPLIIALALSLEAFEAITGKSEK